MVDTNKFAEEESQGYRIDIVGRNLEVTEPMRAYIWNKLSKIERFHNHIMYLHINLEIQRVEHTCVIIAKFGHFKVKVQAASTDMYATIDRAIDRLQEVLSRYKSRIQDHHKKEPNFVDMQVDILKRTATEIDEINDEIEAENAEKEWQKYAPHSVVGFEMKPLKTLTMDEAIMKMDLSGDQFLIYRSEEDKKLKVMYRRTDGDYGLIQPE